ncbi:unnamed protein product [Phaedon cochleariae]|uniref:Uncharacterized protein n=1 Tax=Phaedon cochleariae TaxID=80249 RepID=A0A9P0GMD8_PHACE|nr:unnamed protein product [Phaedon cochleariae]
MSEMYPDLVDLQEDLKMGEDNGSDPQDDVVKQDACAPGMADSCTNMIEGELPVKKRKTRRGKSKRRHPYLKNPRKSNKLVKPEAPHNDNQFLLEDHGFNEELDKNLNRNRDSSFSVDSQGDFYSSPDDEELFRIKDFDDQYESLQAERLQGLSKTELIEEYLMLENKLEQLTKRLQKQEDDDLEDPELKQELERLTIENERLRRENETLRAKCTSDSEDSETDSSDSCSGTSNTNSSSSSGSSRSRSPLPHKRDELGKVDTQVL